MWRHTHGRQLLLPGWYSDGRRVAWWPLIAYAGDRRLRPRLPDWLRGMLSTAIERAAGGVRDVARQYGVSPDTVSRIGREARPEEPRTRKPWRCPTCGGLVATRECVACRTRRLISDS